jgi:protein-disulfide isomerase
VTWPGLVGTGAAAGIGFTVSLLISDLAMHGPLLAQAKLGVLVAGALSTLLATTIFRIIARLPASIRARELGRTAEQLIDLADEVDPERDHIRGALDAKVTLLEYGDFECPYCGRAEPMIRELLESHGYDLRYAFRHLPLVDVHPRAELAAEASEAAGAQGAFWEMHDLLMDNQEHLAPTDLRRYAESLGLDLERFTADLREDRYAERVNEDVASADASGVSGTPTFFVNGRRLHGAFNIDTLTQAVTAAKARAVAAEELGEPVAQANASG